MRKITLLSCALCAFLSAQAELTITRNGQGNYTVTVGAAGDWAAINPSTYPVPGTDPVEYLGNATKLKIVTADNVTMSRADMGRILSVEPNGNYYSFLGDPATVKTFNYLSYLDLSGAQIEGVTESNDAAINPLVGIKNLPKLQTVVFPITDGLVIPGHTLNNKKNLPEYLIFPDYPEGKSYSLGEGAFDATNIHRVSLGRGISSIPMNCFSNNPNLYSLVLDDGITSIGQSAFEKCYGLEYLDLPSELENIGMNAFNLCISMKTVSIPAKVKTFGDNAFAKMYALTDVYVLGTDVPLPPNVFNVEQTTNFKYKGEKNSSYQPTYGHDDYVTTEQPEYVDGTEYHYTIAILHYPAEAKDKYRWPGALNYSLVDPNGTTWPDDHDIDAFWQAHSAKFNHNEIPLYDDDGKIKYYIPACHPDAELQKYIGWWYFLQGNQNEKRDDILEEDRFRDSRWYSVCYPFDVTVDKFENTFGALAALSEFSAVTEETVDGKTIMTLRFERAAQPQRNGVLLKKNHAYMIRPAKLAEVKMENGVNKIIPLRMLNVKNELEHYRLPEVINKYTEEERIKLKIMTNDEVDAYNKTYNVNHWNRSQWGVSPDIPAVKRTVNGTKQEGESYYFVGNYIGKNYLEIPEGSENKTEQLKEIIPVGAYYLGYDPNNPDKWPLGFYHVVSNSSNGPVWTPYTSIIQCPDQPSGAKFGSLDFFDDIIPENESGNVATDMDETLFVRIPLKPTAGKVYTLQGQFVHEGTLEGLPRGMYIVNGQKYVVK